MKNEEKLHEHGTFRKGCQKPSPRLPRGSIFGGLGSQKPPVNRSQTAFDGLPGGLRQPYRPPEAEAGHRKPKKRNFRPPKASVTQIPRAQPR